MTDFACTYRMFYIIKNAILVNFTSKFKIYVDWLSHSRDTAIFENSIYKTN